MIEERATVIDIQDGDLILQAQVQSSCGSCEAKSGCGTSLLSKVLGRRFTHFSAQNIVDAAIGDEVIVGIPERSLLSGSLMIYLLPVMSMLATALIADAMLVADVSARDLIIAVSAVAGLLLGSFTARVYFRRPTSGQQYHPVVLRKIIAHGRIRRL